MVNHTITWLNQYQNLLVWLGALSIITFALSLLLLPWLIKKIPVDYFQRPPQPEQNRWQVLISSPTNLLRNLVGLVVVLAGFAMFILPGQGILTVLVGVAIMQFPGKQQLEHWIVRRKGVLNALNWLRRKTNTPELEI